MRLLRRNLLAAAICGVSILSMNTAQVSAQTLWGLDMIGRHYAFDRGYTGKGTIIGVYDEAARATHDQYHDRFLGGYQAGGTLPFGPAATHGTHVSGTIAGKNTGVAPGAQIYSIQAVGGYTDAEGADAYSWAYRQGIRLINNSWSLRYNGSTYKITDFDRAMIETVRPTVVSALREGARLGVLQVFATDNYAQSQPSVLAGLPYFYPELQNHWLAVTAVGPTKTLASYANECGVAAMWCITAPGGEGVGADGIYSAHEAADDAYTAISGTSMATPHVTGAIAVAAEIFPQATNAELASLILRTATDLGVTGVDSVYGWGLLNLRNVVDAIDPTTAHVYSGAAQSRVKAMADVSNAMRARAAAGLTYASPVLPNAYSPEPKSAASLAIDDAIVTPPPTQLWFNPIYSSEYAPGHTNQVLGGLVGVDLFATDTLTLGIGAGYTSASTYQTGLDNSAQSQNLHLGIYSHWSENDWFATSTAQIAGFSQSVSRGAIAGTSGTSATAQANLNIAGYGLEASTQIGRRFDIANVGSVSPYGSLLVRHHAMADALETGAGVFNLDLAAISHQQAELGIGARLESLPILFDERALTTSLDLGYTHIVGDAQMASGASLLGRAISDTADADQNRSRLNATLSLNGSTTSGASWSASYGLQLQGEAISHAANAGIRVAF
ncbi:S8 family serine peptidase [Devosia sp. WQ 349]|uniref:S8 family peptidase n=1 Tax=Devosia sp. WQ 349K1 TaxID=2800329 RepID=UPI0019038182|nr:S8 family serine peptidase [Devosia sp. WQ 349K1]MBK1793977.1 S8 family serine peptidase [Devosia sp. WQ 349K1]